MTTIRVITDRPLEEMLPDSSNPRVGALEFERNEDERIYCGSTTFSNRLNSLLGTDVERWHSYSVDESKLDGAEAYVLLFVYLYLQKGRHIVLYRQWSQEHFDSEIPVAVIDISDKRPGDTPLRLGEIGGDVLSHFYDSGGTAHGHDVNILWESGRGAHIVDNTGVVPDHQMTVGALVEIAGNSVSAISIYDGRIVEVFQNRPGSNGVHACTEVPRSDPDRCLGMRSTSNPSDAVLRDTASHEFGQYWDRKVEGYQLYGISSAWTVGKLGISGSDIPVSRNRLNMIVLIGNRNK